MIGLPPSELCYTKESPKPFDQTVADLVEAVKGHKFGVHHIHDIGGTLHTNGIELGEKCQVLEVCNHGHAVNILKADIPCPQRFPAESPSTPTANQGRCLSP